MARLGRSRPIAPLVLRRPTQPVAAPPEASGRPKVWTGAAHTEKPGKWWNGSAWVEKPWKRWTGTEWKKIGASGADPAPVLLAQYQGAAASSHVVPLATTTPGQDLVVIARAPAVLTLPSPWTQETIFLDSTHLIIGRLAAASHTAPLTSLTVGLSGSRRLALVAIQGAMDAYADSMALHPPVNGGADWGTGLHTLRSKHAFAVYTTEHNATALSAGPVSFDHGFTLFGDTGVTPSGEEVTRVIVGHGADVDLSSEGVTLHLSPVETGYSQYTGMISWGALSGGTVLRAQYLGIRQSSHTIPFAAATTPGRSLLAVAHAGAVITFPAPWTTSTVYLDSTHIVIGSLSAANHTAPLSSLALGLSGPRQLAVVVVESDMADYYQQFSVQALSGGIYWGNGLPRAPARPRSRCTPPPLPSVRIWPAVVSNDRGFQNYADTGSTPTPGNSDEVVRVIVLRKNDVSFASDGVTITLSGWFDAMLGTTYGGLIAWNNRRVLGVECRRLQLMSRPSRPRSTWWRIASSS